MGTQPTSDAIVAARLAMSKWKIPASIQLAQWAEESGWGKHMSAPYNYWGMKALPGQTYATVLTQEVYKGVEVTVKAAFRSFDTMAQSFDAHAKLLATAGVYAPARAKLPDVVGFASALTGVYATDPHYGAKLVSVIQGSNLMQYDKGVA